MRLAVTLAAAFLATACESSLPPGGGVYVATDAAVSADGAGADGSADASADADWKCAKSCADYGACHNVAGVCKALTDADCAQTGDCKYAAPESATCTLDPAGGVCVRYATAKFNCGMGKVPKDGKCVPE